jgi:hypothetical protein
MSIRFEDLNPSDQKAIREMQALLRAKSEAAVGPAPPTIKQVLEAGGNRCGSCRYFLPARAEPRCSNLHSGHYQQPRQYMTEGCGRYAVHPNKSDGEVGHG